MKRVPFKPRKTQLARSAIHRTQSASDRSTQYVKQQRTRKTLLTHASKARPKPREADDAKNLRDWSRQVRERDDYLCQKCHQWGNEAHHVATRSRRPDLKLKVWNGKTICTPCHNWIHKYPIQATALGLLSDETYELAKSHALRDKAA